MYQAGKLLAVFLFLLALLGLATLGRIVQLVEGGV